MRAIITGANGFVGHHMRRHLESLGWKVTPVDLQPNDDAMHVFNTVDDCPVYDLVVHAAAAGPNRRAIDEQKGNFPYNVMLDAAMFNWAIRTKQRHVVYLSSCAVYPAGLQDERGWRTTADRGFSGDRRLVEDMAFDGDPFDDYGHTKMIGERMAHAARSAGLNVTVVRPFSGYGEDQSEDFPFRAFIERARRRENPFTIWGNADQVRDWIHIDDICASIMTLVSADVQGPVNLCTGVGTTMRQLADLIIQTVGYDAALSVDTEAPMGVFYRVGHPGRLNEFYTPSISIEEGVQRALGRN